MKHNSPHTRCTSPMGKVEFIALMAMLGGVVAYSIDSMLPALPLIGADLSPDNINRAQLVVTSFVFGMGLGTFLVGPLSDAFGRKPVVLIGAAIYAAMALLSALAQTLDLLILARVLQGVSVSSARIVSMAIVRDLYAGREMARLMSFITMVFMIVPAIAPLIGSGIIALAGWRGLLGSFVLFAFIYSCWIGLRLKEPLPKGQRHSFHLSAFAAAAHEVLSNPTVRLSIAVQTCVFSALWAALSSTHQIIGDSYGRPDEFPYWFAGVALISACASLTNARLVMRLGMRRLITLAFTAQIGLSLVVLIALTWVFPNGSGFAVYFLWQAALFSMVSLSLGNLISLAMEPLGHIAGMASSLISGFATVGSVLLAIPIGLSFDGSPLPLILGTLACVIVARLLMIRLNRLADAAN